MTFEEAWAATGRQYGPEELETVRMGWDMALDACLSAIDAAFAADIDVSAQEVIESLRCEADNSGSEKKP